MFHVQSLSCVLGVVAGCSTYNAFPDSDGVKPKDDIKSCVAQSGAPVSSKPAEKSGVCVRMCEFVFVPIWGCGGGAVEVFVHVCLFCACVCVRARAPGRVCVYNQQPAYSYYLCCLVLQCTETVSTEKI